MLRFSLESSHRGNSDEYTQYIIFNIKKEIHPKLSQIFFLEIEERIRNSRGEQAISVWAAEVLLYWLVSWYQLSTGQMTDTTFQLVKWHHHITYSVLPRNFITGDNVPVLLKKWGHLMKKWGHCGKIDGTVIWRLKISFLSVYIITDHILTVNKQY